MVRREPSPILLGLLGKLSADQKWWSDKVGFMRNWLCVVKKISDVLIFEKKKKYSDI